MTLKNIVKIGVHSFNHKMFTLFYPSITSFIFLFCLISFFKISAQNSDTTLAKPDYEDTIKEKALKKASYYISKGDSFYNQIPDSVIFYYKKASVIYEKLNMWKEFAECYLEIGNFHRIKWENQIALTYLNKAIEIVKNKVNNDPTLIAHLYNFAGSVYINTNDYSKSLDFFQRSLSIRISNLGEKNRFVAANYSNIGAVYFYQGDYYTALDFFEKSLRICLKIDSEWSRMVARCYNNIADVYSKTGDLKKALEYNKKALSIRLKVLGEDNIYTAYSYSNLGIIYLNMGEYDKALEFHNKSLAINIINFGDKHFEVAWDNLYIANVYAAKGASPLTPSQQRRDYFKKALKLYNRSLEIMLNTVGQNHSLVAETYYGSGNVYLKQNVFVKALNYYQRSIISLLLKFNDRSIYINPALELSSNEKSHIISKTHLLDALVYKAETFEKMYFSKLN